MNTLVANLCGNLRHETVNGRTHLVAPMTLIVSGVLNGSRGPLYYPPGEVCRSAGDWEGVPLVLGHPTENGRPISAQSIDVLNAVGLGGVRNARCEGGRLMAEGWFDVGRTEAVAPFLLSDLRAGKPIELSTGLFTDNEATSGIHKGRPYSHIARNYRPDHVAILDGEEGACSLRDGCGVNNARHAPLTAEERKDILPIPRIDWTENSHPGIPKRDSKSAVEVDPDAPLVPPTLADLLAGEDSHTANELLEAKSSPEDYLPLPRTMEEIFKQSTAEEEELRLRLRRMQGLSPYPDQSIPSV